MTCITFHAYETVDEAILSAFIFFFFLLVNFSVGLYRFTDMLYTSFRCHRFKSITMNEKQFILINLPKDVDN